MVLRTTKTELRLRAAKRTEGEAGIEPRLASRKLSICPILRLWLWRSGQSADSENECEANASAASPMEYIAVTKPVRCKSQPLYRT